MRGYQSFKSKPHPGMLRQRIEIGVNENVINENGFPNMVEKTICTTWANADDAGNQAYRSADAYDAEMVTNFIIRYRKGIRAGMWVKFRDLKWMIQSIGTYEYNDAYLGLKATIVQGVGR